MKRATSCSTSHEAPANGDEVGLRLFLRFKLLYNVSQPNYSPYHQLYCAPGKRNKSAQYKACHCFQISVDTELCSRYLSKVSGTEVNMRIRNEKKTEVRGCLCGYATGRRLR